MATYTESVTLLAGSRGGEILREGRKRYFETWCVVSRSKGQQVSTVLLAPGLPRLGDSWFTDQGMIVTSLKAREQEDPQIWYVDVEYTNDERADEPPPEDPEDEEPTLSMRFERVTRTFEGEFKVDANGNRHAGAPVVAANGEPFIPQPTYEQTRATLVIKRIEANLNAGGIFAIQDRINNGPFAGAGDGELRINVTDVQEEIHDGQSFWRKTYELAHDPEGWNQFLLNRGTYKVIVGTTEIEYFPDKGGNVGRMRLLNAAGTASTTDANYIKFQPYEAINFGGLGLPEST